jgi:RNA polymerase sigma factor (sigma-70 family)
VTDPNPALARRNALVEAHLDLVEKIARHLKHSKNLPGCFDVDDLAQSGMIGLIRAAEQYDAGFWDRSKYPQPVSFRYFAAIKVRGEILDSVRRRRYRDSTHAELEAAVYEQPDAAEPVDISIRRRQLAGVVERALDGVPDDDRKVLTLYYREERKLAGVGQAFGVGQSRSSQLLQRAHGSVKRALAMRGVTSLAA